MRQAAIPSFTEAAWRTAFRARVIVMAIVAALAVTGRAQASTVVSKSSFSEIITLDTAAQDHVTISVPSTGTIRVADTAGVAQDPDNEAICTAGVSVGVPYLDCSYSVSLSFV